MLAPIAKVTIDRERTMKMTWASYIAFEKATGKKLSGMKMSELSFEDASALIWCSLVSDDPSLTVLQLADMIHSGNQDEILSTLFNLHGQSMPDDDGEGKNEPTPNG